MSDLPGTFRKLNPLQNCSFISGQEGYLAFTNYLAYTQDSGRTLTQRPVTVPEFPFSLYTFQGVKALDANTVLAYGMVPRICPPAGTNCRWSSPIVSLKARRPIPVLPSSHPQDRLFNWSPLPLV